MFLPAWHRGDSIEAALLSVNPEQNGSLCIYVGYDIKVKWNKMINIIDSMDNPIYINICVIYST